MKAALALALLLLGALLCLAQGELTREFKLRRTSPKAQLGNCWDHHEDAEGNLLVTGFSVDREKLIELGFEVISETKGRPLSADPPAGYRNPEQLFTEFQNIAKNYPSIAQLIDITEEYDAPETHEGRHIYALKISDNVSQDEAEPNVLIVSNHHSREMITPELALNTSLELVTKYQSDPAIKKIVNDHQVYIMWTMNPDGLAYVWSNDNMWRKNRKQVSAAVYGVDLNRNYPIGWDYSCGGSTIPSSETYRGDAPASEPETQTMISFQNERRFAKVLDFHSYAREVRIIYGDCASLPSTVDNYFKALGVATADFMRYDQVRSCCMGGNVHFAYHDQASLSFLVETGTAFQPNAATMKEELVRVWPGTLYFLQLPIPISGRVLDRRTGAPVEAQVTVDAIKFNLEEQNFSNPKNGLYHLWLPSGSWNVTFKAEGYPTLSLPLVASASGTQQDILL